MLFLPPGSADIDRIQGSWVSDDEIKAVVNFVSDQAQQEFFDGVIADPGEEDQDDSSVGASEGSGIAAKFLKPDDDDNLKRALEIIDTLLQRGIIGPQPPTGGANREILVDTD